jgi:hypothetical protein
VITRRYSGNRRFRRADHGNNQRRKVDPMMFFALLVPFGLLAVLLGMDRLERWTLDATAATVDSDES